MIDNKILARSMIQNNNELIFDPDSFIQRLFLFDNYILESVRLYEIPYLIKLIGYDGLLILLKSRILRIKCDANQFAQVGQLKFKADWNEKVLGYEQYSFRKISSVEGEYLSSCFKEIESQIKLSSKQFINLKGAIADNLIKSPDDLGEKTAKELLQDINCSEYIIKPLIQKIINEDYNIEINQNDIKLNMKIISDNDILVESNLHKDFKEKFDLVKSHKIVEKVLLSLVSTNFRLETMEAFNSKAILNDKDIFCIENKIKYITDMYTDADTKEKNFARVLEIKKHPKLNIMPDVKIDIDRLMKIRESKNCNEFRSWINTTDKLDDNEINEYLDSYSNTLKSFFSNIEGKTLRFIACTTIGLVNTPAGIISSFADTFLVDKFLSTNGSKIFLREDYPRIFDL